MLCFYTLSRSLHCKWTAECARLVKILTKSITDLCPIHTADATQLSSWVASAVCTQFATSWRQSWRIRTNLPTAKSGCVVSASWMHPSAVMTQFTIILCFWTIEVGDKWRNNITVEKVINIDQIHIVKLLCSVSKLSTESVGSRRKLVANCVHTADATRLNSTDASASAVCTGLNKIWWFTVLDPSVYTMVVRKLYK